MNNMKKLLALLLAIVMVMGMFPVGVLANEAEPEKAPKLHEETCSDECKDEKCACACHEYRHLETCVEGCEGKMTVDGEEVECECECHFVHEEGCSEECQGKTEQDEDCECTCHDHAVECVENCQGETKFGEECSCQCHEESTELKLTKPVADESEKCATCGSAEHTTENHPAELEKCATCGSAEHTTENHPAEPEKCATCGSAEHTTENHPAEPEKCATCGSAEHTTENHPKESAKCELCQSTEHVTNQCTLFCGFCQTVPCKCEPCIECKLKNDHTADCSLRPCDKCGANPCECEPTETTTAPTEAEEVLLVESELRAEVDGVTIKVSGKLPEGAVLEAKIPEDEIFENEKFIKTVSEMIPQRDYFNYNLFYDISILVNGEKWQPGENAVTVTFENLKLDNDEQVEVYHILEDEEAILNALEEETAQKIDLEEKVSMFKAIRKMFSAEPVIDLEKEAYYTVNSSEDGDVVKKNNSISFETKSFSIYIVTGYNENHKSERIQNNQTIYIKRDEILYLKWEYVQPAEYPNDEFLNRGTWTVESGGEFVDLEVYNDQLQEKEPTPPNPPNEYLNYIYGYYWMKLRGVKPSGSNEIKIQFEYPVVTARKYKCGCTVPNNRSHTCSEPNDQVAETIYERRQEYVYIQVEETAADLYIEDQIPENGCLVPKFKEKPADMSNIEFVWTRSDSKPIKEDALKAPYAVSEGAVNVGIDRGGIDDNGTSSPDIKTYTVTAKFKDTVDAAGNVTQAGNQIGEPATYTVYYGNELLNGSFEYPLAHAITHDYPNDAEGLYWKTTSKSIRLNEVCQDIEIISNQFTQHYLVTTYGISKLRDGVTFNNKKLNYVLDSKQHNDAANSPVVPDTDFPDGNQVAEINCDAPGALYQDVLTYPGAELYWSLAHRARNYSGSSYTDGGAWLPDGVDYSYQVTHKDTGAVKTITDMKDYMYVVIAPTAQVEHIETQTQLDQLIAAANGQYGREHTATVDGVKITYSIWEVADDHTAWVDHDNADAPYTVKDGAYLTRFFFAAGDTSHDRWRAAKGYDINWSGGNFIDKVVFNDNMPYRVEYYLDGVLLDELTETGWSDEGPNYTQVVSASHTGDARFASKYLMQTRINDRTHSGTSMTGIYSDHNVLQLYYVSYGAKVAKQIQIDGYDALSDAEKETIKTRIAAYKPKFELRKVENGTETKISEVEITINQDSFSGFGEFLVNGNPYKPVEGATYKIVETDVPDIENLELYEKAADYTYTVPNGEYFIEYNDAVNKFKLHSTLTITKDADDADLDENQKFLFQVKGVADTATAGIDITVSVSGEDSVTINNLPLGDYVVSELTDWSWRYTLKDIFVLDSTAKEQTANGVTVTVDLNGNTVTFRNARTEENWLSGDSYVKNHWIDGGVTTTKPKK